ncbi:nuclear transport factor 2 family protein [Ramlibacter sp. WS9]|uniref:nuclear transport factor 2 family protein n=1 Tax=Ramlibacter sp. WS9 TaxID=1882741 RepID=UPI001142427D|nr:nuclear transport factor 2 family protein [Ramlibacter sp. WS9]ROZ78863.1 nuclear transport factor 2 family protein [Ramlibacter sp. WS9]
MSEATELNLAAIADRYAAAWLSHKPEAIVALHTPDSTFQAHGRNGQVKGKAALLKEFAEVFERYPNFGFETRRLLLGDRHWTLDWDLTFQPPGKERRKFHAVDVVEVDDDGLVTRKDTFFDFAQVKAAFEAK